MPVAAAASLKLLFWLLILLPLYLFWPNRSPKAWWIGVPVVVSALVAMALVCLMVDKDWTFEAAGGSFVVGLAAVWLLMPYLMSHSRVAAFFKTLPVLAGYSLLAFVPTLLGPRQGLAGLPAATDGVSGDNEPGCHAGAGLHWPFGAPPVWTNPLHRLAGSLDGAGLDSHRDTVCDLWLGEWRE